MTVNCQFDNLSILNGTVPGGGATVGVVDTTRNFRWERTADLILPDRGPKFLMVRLK